MEKPRGKERTPRRGYSAGHGGENVGEILRDGAHRCFRSPNPVGSPLILSYCAIPVFPRKLRPHSLSIALDSSLISLPPVWTFQCTLYQQPSIHPSNHSLSKHSWRGGGWSLSPRPTLSPFPGFLGRMPHPTLRLPLITTLSTTH